MAMDNPVNEALKKLKSARVELQNQLRGIDQAIKSLEQSIAIQNSDSPKDYDDEWSIANKFIYLLKRENRFLHFREAAEFIVDLEGRGDIKDIAAKLTSGTNLIKKDGTIIKYQASNQLQDTFWGSPKWLDEAGKIKSGHEYNTKFLYSSGVKKTFIEF
jgi:hypothetical protein